MLEVARGEDLAAILAIEKVSFPTSWSRDQFVQELRTPTSKILVARLAIERGPVLVGYVCWSFAAGEIDVRNLAVHPDFRRCGIGRRLLQAVIAEARGQRATGIYLEVRQTNPAAARLYEAAGFVRIGYRRNYYGPGEAAILMALTLGSIGE